MIGDFDNWTGYHGDKAKNGVEIGFRLVPFIFHLIINFVDVLRQSPEYFTHMMADSSRVIGNQEVPETKRP